MKSTIRGVRLPIAVAALLLAAAAGTVCLAQGPLEISPLRSYADVAEKAMPAVVNISTDKVVESNGMNPFFDDPLFRRFFNMPDDENHGGGNGNGNERVEHSLGSGVVISGDGYILTNNHVVENASKIVVTFMGDIEYTAEVVGTDPPTDVALIKIDAKNLPALQVGDSDLLRIGDQVMAIGNPFGVGQTVTMGIVSALGRNIGLMDYADLIQTDASINPGNSGGALVNMRGELVGMNSAILSRSGGSQGIGFAIPTNMAMKIVEDLRGGGEVVRAYLGVMPQPVDQTMADYYGMDRPRGVLVAQVNKDTPAAKAGLKDGDIILSVDGKEIKNPSMLRNLISLSDVGHDADLEIIRDGKTRSVRVKLEKLPESIQTAQGGGGGESDDDGALAGVTIREITDRTRAMTELPDDIQGLLVMNVEQTSNAAREGLAQGDVIQEVDRVPVRTFAEFKAALAQNPDRPVFMRVYKPQQQRSVFIAIPR